jgi:hypothetical protein
MTCLDVGQRLATQDVLRLGVTVSTSNHHFDDAQFGDFYKGHHWSWFGNENSE